MEPRGGAALAAIGLLVGLSMSSIRASAPDPARGYADALALYRDGELDAALEAVDAVLSSSPSSPGLWPLRGWILIRLGRPAEADEAFRQALAREPGNPDALAGRGVASLHREDPAQALIYFEEAIRSDPGHEDARRGAVRALQRLGRNDEAAARLAPLRAAHAGDAELAELDASIEAALEDPAVERRPRPPADPSEPLQVVARAGETYLEIHRGDGTYQPLFVKGVNLGVALPGRFPTGFPTDPGIYGDWLERIAGMNANSIRLYTLLPPAFYRALADHNRDHPDRRLWLIQGVWVELPPGDDFEDASFQADFRREIERVIDACHGNLDLPARPGHASGRYRADVSDSVLAFILGREWEPFSVIAHDELHPGTRSYEGRFARMQSGSAMEAWMAWVCDVGTGYETDRYRRQRPVAFSNWPTLDPLDHPTETSRAEENLLRRAQGEAVREKDIPQYDDDAVSIDAERIQPTAANHAGFFASYHVYPYHPDFMVLEPGLQQARDSVGASPYIGYLRRLKEHHRGRPLLVAELGVPTSRGVAHVHPLGWDHGGHTDAEQGEIDARMMLDVFESGCAGGVLFAWLDEWFKRTWIVADQEIPPERDRLWHNLLDPEENFGLLAARAAGGPRTDGDASEWSSLPGALLVDGRDGACGDPRIRRAGAAVDDARVHLLVEIDGADCDGDGAIDWDRLELLVGIDTHGDERGEHRLSPGDDPLLDTGVEFRVRLRGPDRSDVQVVPSYDVGAHLPDGPFVSRPSEEGTFVSMTREANRRRIGRDGTEYPARHVDQSPLRFADGEAAFLDDVAAAAHDGSGVIELRLPWNLLNVTDPSSHRILDQAERHPPPFDTSTTDRFLFHLSLRDAAGRQTDALTVGPFHWDGWDEPNAVVEPKESYRILAGSFAALPGAVGEARP